MKQAASAFCALLAVLAAPLFALPSSPAAPLQAPKLMSMRTLDMNAWRIYTTNYGLFVTPAMGGSGGFWGGPGYNYIYGAGLWFGCSDSLHVHNVSAGYDCASGQSEFGPVNPYTEEWANWLTDPLARVYLSTDQADLMEWPVRDSLNNPVVMSLQESYCKYSDMNPNYTWSGENRTNIVVEQVSYAWNYADNNDVVFFLFLAKNKNPYWLDSCYIAPAVDCDIGNESGSSANDRTAFDYARNLAMQFQATPEAGWPKTGVVGFRFLEGPLNNNGYDVQVVDDQYPHTIPQGAMLGLTAFTIFTISIDPKNDDERFQALEGRDWFTGIMDAYDQFGTEQAGDKRFVMASGPFRVGPDSSAGLVVAVICADDTARLKLASDVAQEIYNNGFVLASPPEAPQLTAVPGDGKVYLSWNNAVETTPDPFYATIDSTPYWYAYFRGSWEHCYDKMLVDSFEIKTGTSTSVRVARGAPNPSGGTDTLYARYSQKAMYYPYDFQAYALYRAATREDLAYPAARTQLGVLHTGSSGAKSRNWDRDDGMQIVIDIRQFVYVTPGGTYYLPIYDTLGTDCGLAYGFVDTDVMNGMTYWYGLSAMDYQPNSYFTRKSATTLASDPSQLAVSAVPASDPPGSQPAGIQIRVDVGDTAATDYWYNTKVVNPPAVPEDSFKLFWQEAAKRSLMYYGRTFYLPVYTGILRNSQIQIMDTVLLDPEIFVDKTGTYFNWFFGPSRDETPFGGIVFQPYLDYHKEDCIIDSIVIIESPSGVRTYPRDSVSIAFLEVIFDATNSLWQWRGSDFEIRWQEDTLRVSGNLRNILRAQVWDLTNNVEVPIDTLTKTQMTTSGWAFNPANVTGLSFCDSTLSGATSGAGLGMHICGLSLYFNKPGIVPHRIGSLWDQRPENGDVWRIYCSGPRPPHQGGQATFILSPAVVGVNGGPNAFAPDLLLAQNLPNPFRQQTTINYQLTRPGLVSLRIYNVAGQMVRTLASSAMPAGSYSATWDGRDESGRRVSAGVYLYQLRANDRALTRKMVLVR